MSRKSKHEELRARAFGSETDNEAEASNDIVGRGREYSKGGGSGGEEVETEVEDAKVVFVVVDANNWRGEMYGVHWTGSGFT
jgi:hypothetical protein